MMMPQQENTGNPQHDMTQFINAAIQNMKPDVFKKMATTMSFADKYKSLPTMQRFHDSKEAIRCMVGPVGSGKTTAATWEVCNFIPCMLYEKYGIKKTRGVIVRNTYSELIDTTQRTVFDWFDWGTYRKQEKNYTLKYSFGPELEILFRSCDNPKDVKKFKSLEITWYWIDESIEVAEEIKKMLKNRIGRFPIKSPVRYGIETTNPPDVEHLTYSQFKWDTPPPGPIPDKEPLKGHAGFWQPPRENEANLRKGYYDDLMDDYADSADWAEMYIDGKPGIIIRGKLVYNNFDRKKHVAVEPLIWSKGKLYFGWDNSGNRPACAVLQIPTANQIQILAEFHTDRMGIVDFTKLVKERAGKLWPDAEIEHWADPAGENTYSKREGGFTSNAQLMEDECKIRPYPSEQNWTVRTQAVDKQLGIPDGLLIDPSCIRLINGFLGGFCYPKIGVTEEYSEKPVKNKFADIHDGLQYVMVKLVMLDHFKRYDPTNLDGVLI